MIAPLLAGALGAGIGAGLSAAGITTLTMAAAMEIGWTVGTILYSIYQFANQEVVESTYTGPRLGDLQVQSASWGRPIPRIYGSYRIAGEVIWALPLNETKHEDEQSSGKGGGGTKTTRIWYTYDATWAVALCEQEMAGVNKIWFDNVLVYDGSNYDSQSGLTDTNWSVYNGSADQSISWLMESDNPESTPAYRGMFYIVFESIELENTGNRIPNVTVEISKNYTIEYTEKSNTIIPSNITDRTSYPYALGGLCPRNSTGIGIMKLGDWISSTPVSHPEYDPEGPNVESSSYMLYPGAITYVDKVYHYGIGYQKLGGSSSVLCDIEGKTPESEYLLYKTYFDDIRADKYARIYTTIDLDDIQKWSATYEHLIAVGIPGGVTLNDKEIFIVKMEPTSTVLTGIDIIEILDGTEYESYIEQYTINISEIPEIPETEYILEATEMQGLIYIRTTAGTIYNLTKTGEYISTLSATTNVNNRGESGFMCSYGNTIHLLTSTYIAYTINTSGFIVGLDVSSNISGIDFKYNTMSGISGLFTIRIDTELLSFSILTLISVENLDKILIDAFDRSGLLATDYDVTDLEDIEVMGFIISRESSTRDIIQELIFTYNFELIEDNGILLARKLINSVYKGEIPEDDIIDYAIYTKKQELDLPKTVSFQYMNKESDYNTGVQVAKRINTSSDVVQNFGTAAVVSDDYAKQQAEILLYNMWVADESLKFSIPNVYLNLLTLTPGDIIQLTYKSFTKLLKVNSISVNTNSTIEINAISFHYNSYISNAVGSNTDNYDAVVNLQGPTKLAILDIPNINDDIDDEGIYLAASGLLPNWAGCNIYTTDQNNELSILEPVVSYTKMGVSETILATGSTTTWDLVNTFTVVMYGNQIPYGITPEKLLVGDSGSNYAILGKEIIQFKDVTPLGNSRYIISTLLRGRRGTEVETLLHTENEDFVIFDANMIFDYNASKSIESYYRAVTFGLFPESSSGQYFTPEIIRKKPLSATMLEHTQPSIDIELYWTRRSRQIKGRLMSIPLFEETKEYEIDIYISDIFKRTFVTTDLTTNLTYASSIGTKYNCKLIYTEADQITDGYTGTVDTLKFIVYQMSTLIGRGFPAEYII